MLVQDDARRQFDGLLPRSAVDQVEAAQGLLGLREGPIGDLPLPTLQPESGGLGFGAKAFPAEHLARRPHLAVELDVTGHDALGLRLAARRLRLLVAMDQDRELHVALLVGWPPKRGLAHTTIEDPWTRHSADRPLPTTSRPTRTPVLPWGEARPPLAVDPGDAGPERAQLALNVLVAAIDLLDAANDGAAVGAEGGDDEGDAGPDVRARDPGRFASQARRPLDEGAMRVAQDHTGAHPDQPVDEEHPALVHLLVKEDGSPGLGGSDQGHAHEVGGEGGPRAVVHARDSIAEVALDGERLSGGDHEVGPDDVGHDPQPPEH